MLTKYLEVTLFKLKTEYKFLANYIFTMFSFAIHVIVFSSIWDYILKGDLVAGYTKEQLIWYVIVGEFVLYSVSNSYRRIAEMVRQGDIINLLVKPINFVFYIFFEELSNFVKVMVNLVFGIILGLIMAGPISLGIIQVILLSISLLLAVLLSIFFQMIIGLCAFVTEENKSIYLVIQKLQLLLVFSPLEFFPVVAQKIFKLLPTTYTVFAPAKILVHYTFNSSVILILFQIISCSICSLLIYLLYIKGVKKINVNGG